MGKLSNTCKNSRVFWWNSAAVADSVAYIDTIDQHIITQSSVDIHKRVLEKHTTILQQSCANVCLLLHFSTGVSQNIHTTKIITVPWTNVIICAKKFAECAEIFI